MSINVMSRVWADSNASESSLLIMLALADRADEDGICWPGFEWLKKKSRIKDERHVRRILRRQEEAGELYASPGQGRGHTSLYLICIGLSEDEISRALVRRFEMPVSEALAAAQAIVAKRTTAATPDAAVAPEAEEEKGGLHAQKGVCTPPLDSDEKGVCTREKGVCTREKGVCTPPDPLEIHQDPSEGDRAREQTDPPAAPSQFPDTPPIELVPAVTTPKKPTVVKAQGPYMQPGMRLPGGFVPAGQGQNPVQVYYERFNYGNPDARLNRPQEDDLARLCPDLEKLREVITAYSRTNYRPGNIQLILDWYRNGAPGAERRSSKSAGYGRPERGGTSPRKGKTDAIDQDMLEFLRDFKDARDGTSALAAD